MNTTLRNIVQNEIKQLLSEQDEKSVSKKRKLKSEDSRIMSADRGPFRDKMKGDPFEYTIVGDPCDDPEGIKFKVTGFSKLAKRKFRNKWKKITAGQRQRTLEKDKYIWKRGKLKGQDSWEILRKTLGGADLICQRVTEAEKKHEKKSKLDFTDQEPMQDPTIRGKKKAKKDGIGGKDQKIDNTFPRGSLRYYIKNNTTGIDPKVKKYIKSFAENDDTKSLFRDAVKKIISKQYDKEIYKPINMGYSFMQLSDDPISGASARLDAALKLIFNKSLPREIQMRALDLSERIYDKLGSWEKVDDLAKKESDILASELKMPYFGTVSDAKTKKEEEPEVVKKEKEIAKEPAAKKKLKYPQGNLMNKEFDIEGMKMKVTEDRLILDGKPYKATVFGSNMSFNNMSFKKIVGKPDSIEITGSALFKTVTTNITWAGLIQNAKDLRGKNKTTISTPGNPDIKITPASSAVSESRQVTPAQLNQIILREMKRIQNENR